MDQANSSQPAVTVYTAGPSCYPCRFTTRDLDKAGIAYSMVPIDSDPLITEAALFLGMSTAPVVCVGDDEFWAGYRPDRIAALRTRITASTNGHD